MMGPVGNGTANAAAHDTQIQQRITRRLSEGTTRETTGRLIK